MKFRIHCVGRAPNRQDVYSKEIQAYCKRINSSVDFCEINISKKNTKYLRQKEEEENLLGALHTNTIKIFLDRRGRELSSRQFADYLEQQKNQGLSKFDIVIGGPDGFSENFLSRGSLILALGVMTWPHLLVRTMLLEQLYRAQCILEGHPYHK